MTNVAHSGTTRALWVLLVALGGCTSDSSGEQAAETHIVTGDGGPALGGDAQSVGSHADAAACSPLPCPSGASWSQARCACVAGDAGQTDAGQSAECTLHSDCAVITRGCCACPPSTLANSVAVPSAQRQAAQNAQCPGDVNCSPCPQRDPAPLAPLFKAACVAQRCELLDLRADPLSSCASDTDCVATGLGCCPPSTSQLTEYVGVNQGADLSLLACFPVPPCVPPQAHVEPVAYCATDKHCAVRARETDAGVSGSCYSPTQNVAQAYDVGAVGCDCAPGSAATCVPDATGRMVGLICSTAGGTGSRWSAVQDGPCGKKP